MFHRFNTLLLVSLIAAGCSSSKDKEKASVPADQSAPTSSAEKKPAPAPTAKAASSTEKTAAADSTKAAATDSKAAAAGATKTAATDTTKTTTDATKSASSGDTAKMPVESAKPSESLLALKVTTLDGKPADLASYKGKVTLVVNVASQCGYTPQYAGLETLYKELEPKGFVILGFPSNDFGGQEPGSAEEIQTFCSKNYGVTFPMFSKVQTKTGAEQSPVYTYLNAATGKLPNWNFCKYLVGKDGKAIAFYPSKVKPTDDELRKAIDTALAAK